MKKFFLMLALLLVCTMQAQEQPTGRDNKYNHVAISALSPLSLSPQSSPDAPARAEQAQGLSASFAGVVNGRVLVAGGCNFAETPAAEGGRKIFYNAAFLLEDDGSWRQVGELPVACAYGMSVTVDDGVVCIGGTDGGQALSAVFLLQTDGQNQLKVKNLPALPAGVEQGAAGYDAKGYIYVAGGKVAGKSSTSAWRLKYPGGTRWEALPPMPGRGRIQPAGVVQNGSTGPLFLVLGGYDEAAGAQAACVHENGVVYDPRTNAWKTTAPVAPNGRPMAIVGATAVTSGYSHVVCFGGVNREIFLDAITRPARLAAAQEQGDTALVARLEQEQAAYLLHPEAWYQFNDELLIYHTITDTWVTESRSPKLARAGAAVVRCGNRWVVVNGESKPGIRSTDVTAVSMTVRTDFGWLNWTVLALYLLGMLALGFYFMRREGGSEDFFKGGGRIPWWAAGISIYATMLSAITYMAYPAKA
ncbi:MAG: cyclically-permuted mutarotase family protein, partial [Alloprevotella sp.]